MSRCQRKTVSNIFVNVFFFFFKVSLKTMEISRLKMRNTFEVDWFWMPENCLVKCFWQHLASVQIDSMVEWNEVHQHSIHRSQCPHYEPRKMMTNFESTYVIHTNNKVFAQSQLSKSMMVRKRSSVELFSLGMSTLVDRMEEIKYHQDRQMLANT